MEDKVGEVNGDVRKGEKGGGPSFFLLFFF